MFDVTRIQRSAATFADSGRQVVMWRRAATSHRTIMASYGCCTLTLRRHNSDALLVATSFYEKRRNRSLEREFKTQSFQTSGGKIVKVQNAFIATGSRRLVNVGKNFGHEGEGYIHV
jgi:hypothetical protein